ncbi:MAG: hypothetical protein ACLP1X_34040 [Polyangiaceae bacterium]|jgi:hypothetical protein
MFRRGVQVLGSSAACVWACSNAATDRSASEAGIDGATAAAGDVDAAEAGQPEGGCPATPCSGACVQGRCLVTLAQASSPAALVVDLKSAYFTSCAANGGAALSVPLGGGSPVTLASGPGCAVGLAVDTASLYVAGLDGDSIMKVPVAGGALTSVAPSPDAPIGVAVDATNVYWTTAGGSVMKAPIGGGTPMVLASGQKSCTRPVVDSATASVYWGDPDDGTIMRVPLDGGASTLVTSGGAATDIAVAGADVVFASGYTLMKAPLGGGSPTSLGTAAGAPVLAVASDGASAYFTSYGSIWKVALAAGQGAAVASNQDAPSAIAVDATSVYWTNGQGGQVMKLTPK